MIEAQDKRKKQVEKELETAGSVRKQSMERLSQTKEREGKENGKKRKKSGYELVDYFQGKKMREEIEGKSEYELKERQLALEEKKDFLDLKTQEQMLREKELQLLMRQQEERDKLILETMNLFLENQQTIFQRLNEQKAK
eukprot:gene3545-2032_t